MGGSYVEPFIQSDCRREDGNVFLGVGDITAKQGSDGVGFGFGFDFGLRMGMEHEARRRFGLNRKIETPRGNLS
jgi:hypothetical protein